MPLQSSGAISLSQIKTELGSGSNSLRTLSAAAGKSAPDAFSEFYGYSAADVTFTFTGGNTSSSGKFATVFNGVDTVPYNTTAYGSFSDSSAGGVTFKALYHTSGYIPGAYVAVSGSYANQSFATVTGYRYLKIGSTIVFDSQGLDLIGNAVVGSLSTGGTTRWYNNFNQTTTVTQQTALMYTGTHTVTLSN